jgi:hypothetical protein
LKNIRSCSPHHHRSVVPDGYFTDTEWERNRSAAGRRADRRMGRVTSPADDTRRAGTFLLDPIRPVVSSISTLCLVVFVFTTPAPDDISMPWRRTASLLRRAALSCRPRPAGLRVLCAWDRTRWQHLEHGLLRPGATYTASYECSSRSPSCAIAMEWAVGGEKLVDGRRKATCHACMR